MKAFIRNWIFCRQRKGKWSDLTREERKRAKAFIHSAVAGSSIATNTVGKIEIKVLREENENGSD